MVNEDTGSYIVGNDQCGINITTKLDNLTQNDQFPLYMVYNIIGIIIYELIKLTCDAIQHEQIVNDYIYLLELNVLYPMLLYLHPKQFQILLYYFNKVSSTPDYSITSLILSCMPSIPTFPITSITNACTSFSRKFSPMMSDLWNQSTNKLNLCRQLVQLRLWNPLHLKIINKLFCPQLQWNNIRNLFTFRLSNDRNEALNQALNQALQNKTDGYYIVRTAVVTFGYGAAYLDSTPMQSPLKWSIRYSNQNKLQTNPNNTQHTNDSINLTNMYIKQLTRWRMSIQLATISYSPFLFAVAFGDLMHNNTVVKFAKTGTGVCLGLNLHGCVKYFVYYQSLVKAMFHLHCNPHQLAGYHKPHQPLESNYKSTRKCVQFLNQVHQMWKHRRRDTPIPTQSDDLSNHAGAVLIGSGMRTSTSQQNIQAWVTQSDSVLNMNMSELYSPCYVLYT